MAINIQKIVFAHVSVLTKNKRENCNMLQKSLVKVEVRFMKRTIGNKLNDYKHLKPSGSEFLPRLVMIRRAVNVVFRRNRYAWCSLKKLFVQRMKAKHPEAVKKWPRR